MYRRGCNPNRPEAGANLRPHEREMGNGSTGKAARDGYTVLERRPRVSHVTEPVALERADRIEDYAEYARGLGFYE